MTENYFPEYTYKAEGDGAFFSMQMTLSSHGGYDDLIENGDYPFETYPDMTEEDCARRRESAFPKNVRSRASRNITRSSTTIRRPSWRTRGFFWTRIPDVALFGGGALEHIPALQAVSGGADGSGRSGQFPRVRPRKDGAADDTAFFFYADHSAYYHNQNYILKGVPEGEPWNTALYNLPCFLWYGGSMDCKVSADGFYEGYHAMDFTASEDTDSPLQGGRTVDKFACTFDVMPTLLHLVGFDYNLNLFQGVSMLSDRTSVFVSGNRASSRTIFITTASPSP